MFLLRVGILFLVLSVSSALVPKTRCQVSCNDSNRPAKLCTFNGRCKFEFSSRCDLNYYNCQYGFQFIVVWGDLCKNPQYGTCNTFYDTSKHSYFPLPMYQR